MKKIYLIFTAVLFGANVNAQITLTKTANEPVVGNIVMTAEYDSTTAVPKATGTGQNWNFTGLTLGTFTEATTYTTAASTPAGSLFPTANIAGIRGSSDYEYYNNATGSISYVGMANSSQTTITSFTNTAVKLNWPTAFGNSNSDPFAAIEVSPTSTVNWNGVISYTASGTGTVTLPNGNKHNNCLQVKSIITITMTGSSTGTMTIINYEYYSSSNRYPILRLEYQSMTQGTVTNTGFNAMVDVAALSVGINEQNASNDGIVVYPNPAKDAVHVVIGGNSTAEKMELYDVTGKLVLSASNTNTLNTSFLAKGVYVLKVKTGNSFAQKQIVISE